MRCRTLAGCLVAVLAAAAAVAQAATDEATTCTACAATPLSLPPPVTFPFDSGVGAGSDDLPLDDPRVARAANATATSPEQVLLLLDDQPGVVVTWATGEGLVGTKEAARPPAPASVVHYGRKAAQLDNRATTAAKPGAYVQTYPNATYSSPYFHRVRLTGLEAGETYHYKVGSDKGGWSSVRSFRAPPGPTNNPRYPLRLVVVGDLGATVNTTSTLDHVAISDGDAALNLGDFVYADNFTPNNALRVLTPPTSPNGTYQPRWDAWGRLVSPVFASLPFAPLPGNHEVETDANGKQWQAYTNRLAPDGPTWYSTTIGPVHVAVLDSYAGWAVGTKQADWLAKDLASVDRSATPWVIVAMHAPWYSSYYKHYKTVECMRIALEPIMVEHGVDLVFAGHIHAYERSHRTVAWKPSACGPYHITAGDGGNSEKLYTTFVDPWGNATMPDEVACPPREKGDACARKAEGPFCPGGVPAHTAFREPSFGHGVLEVQSATRARWTWHRNRDGKKEAADAIVLTRGEELCASVGGAPAGRA